MFKILVTFFLGFFMTLPAMAFLAADKDTNIGLFSRIRCGGGVNCSKVKGAMEINTNGPIVTLSSSTALTANNCGTTFMNANTAGIQADLPAAADVIGCTYGFRVDNGVNFLIHPNGNDAISPLGAATERIFHSSVGSTITIRAVKSGVWGIFGTEGTWVNFDNP